METSQSFSSEVLRPATSTSKLRQTTSLVGSETGSSRTSYLPTGAITALPDVRQRSVSTFSQFGLGHSACPSRGTEHSTMSACSHSPRIHSERTTRERFRRLRRVLGHAFWTSGGVRLLQRLLNGRLRQRRHQFVSSSIRMQPVLGEIFLQ